MKIDKDDLKRHCAGRWPQILNLPESVTDRRHHPCPKCGGNDRFRVLDDFSESGAVLCNQCHSSGNGDGIATYQWLHGCSFRDALAEIADASSYRPAKSNGPKDPFAGLEEMPWNPVIEHLWCEAKQGIKPGALQRLGAKHCRYGKDGNVFAIPVWGPQLDDKPPVGWTLINTAPDQGFQLANGERVKIKNTPGSKKGLICNLDDFRECLDQDHQWWKVEGPTDLLAALSADFPPDHKFFTTANGAGERPADWLPPKFADTRVHVVHDADKPGQEGAIQKWCPALHAAGATVKNVKLPFPIEPHHGPDLRDFFRGGGLFQGLMDQVELAEDFEPSEPGESDRVFTDVANAERFAKQYGDQVRYVHHWKSFLIWNGKRWVRDETGEIQQMAKRVAMSIYTEAGAARDIDHGEKLASWAKSSHSKQKLDAMITLAKSEKPIPVHYEQIDASAELLNCENGTVNLATGDLMPHDPGHMMMMSTGVEIADRCTSALWLDFLETVFASDKELIRYVQKLMGTSLIGRQVEEILPILCGNGKNGKSVFVHAIQKALGDYAIQASRSLLFGREKEHEVAVLFRKRLAIITETNEGASLNENMVKALTGGDKLRGAHKYENSFEFDASHTAVMATNHRPRVRGTDYGIWRRLKIIPFDVTIPEAKRDKLLRFKLEKSELPHVLRWLVDGCVSYLESGLDLSEPEKVKLATTEYRSEQDVLGSWIAEQCVTGDHCYCRASEMNQAFNKWAKDAGEKSLSHVAFAKRMDGLGFRREPRNDGNYWLGVDLQRG